MSKQGAHSQPQTGLWKLFVSSLTQNLLFQLNESVVGSIGPYHAESIGDIPFDITRKLAYALLLPDMGIACVVKIKQGFVDVFQVKLNGYGSFLAGFQQQIRRV